VNPGQDSNYGNVFQGARVLITGGAGFIGSHLARRLAALGAHVRVLDDLSGGHARNLEGEPTPGTIELHQASILDPADLARAVAGCRFVFHQAAMVSVPQSVEQPARCMEVNVVGTERVLAAARQAGVQRVMFAASAAAYGNAPSLPSKETDLPDCWSPYAVSKVTGEMLLQTYSRCYALSTISLRYFNIFGPRQDPKSPYAAVISAFADALIAGRTPRVLGDGEQTRDFTPIENVVHANLLAASSEKPLMGEVVNIGCGGRIRLLDVLSTMGRVLGVCVAPEFGPPRAGDVRHSSADIGRAKALLGYEPVMPFEEGIRRTLEWARS
jgi:UDP-glucose 4-epimerase